MPKLGLGLSLPQTRIAGGFTPKKLSGLSLWLKADAGVTIATSGPFTYVSQIVISGSNTPNVNGTYNASSVPTFEFEGMPNPYFLIGPTYAIEWLNPTFYLDVSEIAAGASWSSSNGTSWTILESRLDTITISGSETPNVNGVYTNPDFGYVFYGPTYAIENYGNFELLDQSTSTIYYTASSATGPWTIVDGSGAITSTSTLVPTGSITATKVVSSSAVSAWADQSVNGRNASPNNGSASLTTIGGNAFIDFPSGTDMFLPAIWGDIEVVGTILVVAYFTSSVNNSVMLSHSTDTSFDFGRGISGTNTFFLRNYPTDYVTSSLSVGNNGKNILEATFDSSTASLYLNGTSCGSGLGASITGLSQFFIGQGPFNVAEIVVYNRVLTTPERQQVEAYLIDKYAIVTISKAFNSSNVQVGSTITGNIPSSWVLSSNVASVIFANNGSVIQIGSRALENNSLTSVTIPNSVTSIGATAFFTNNLASVTLGTSLSNIGSGAFRNNQLTSITIPINVTTINGSVFRDNTNLASVNCYTTYGAFVGNFAFLNTASALTIHVRAADNTWTIGSQSFQGNPNVTVIKDL